MESKITAIAIINMLIKKVSIIFLNFACKDTANRRQYKIKCALFYYFTEVCHVWNEVTVIIERQSVDHVIVSAVILLQ